MLGETFSEFVTSCLLSAGLGGLISISDVDTRVDLRYTTITMQLITKATQANLRSERCISGLHLPETVSFRLRDIF